MPALSALSELQRDVIARARTATLATIAPDGRPRLVPICFVLFPESPDASDNPARLHSPLDDKPKTARDPRMLARVRDLVARPAATILVDRWSEDWAELGWLRLDVRGELVEPSGPDQAEHAGAVAALRVKYPQYANHDLDGRPVLRFTVERVVAWGVLDA